MKIAILYGPSDLRMEEQPLDSSNLEPDEVWVRTQITGFKIGTDRGNFEGAEQVPGAPDYPRWVGDSNLGTAEGVGSGVTAFQVGDTVLSSMHHQSEYVAKVHSGSGEGAGRWSIRKMQFFGNLYSLSAHCYHKGNLSPGRERCGRRSGERWAWVPSRLDRSMAVASPPSATVICVSEWPKKWAPTASFAAMIPSWNANSTGLLRVEESIW